jgi:hypothetical protein
LAAIKGREWRAAVAIMDRVYGRPQERVETKDITEKDPDEMSMAELLASLRERVNATS